MVTLRGRPWRGCCRNEREEVSENRNRTGSANRDSLPSRPNDKETRLHCDSRISWNLLTRFGVIEFEVSNQHQNDCLHLDDRHLSSDAMMRTSDKSHQAKGWIVVLWQIKPSFWFDWNQKGVVGEEKSENGRNGERGSGKESDKRRNKKSREPQNRLLTFGSIFSP